MLNPRNLNGHATIPAPPMSCTHLSPSKLSRSKWSVNSAGSCEDNDKCHPPSIDLEWENDDDFEAAAAKATEIPNSNNKNNKLCDLDTCSVSTTVNIPCTKNGSRTSSHISLPGLDWDSQVSQIQFL